MPHQLPCCLEQGECCLLGGVATPSLASEQSILATFHRKPDLRDRTGRKQQPLPAMSEASLMSGEPGLPVVSRDSDLDQLPGPDPEDHPGAAAAALSSGPCGLDTHQACSWPELRTLLQQLPPQDSDERYCLALGKEEQAELQLFHAQRKQEALGQGVARLVPPQLEGYTCEKVWRTTPPKQVWALLLGLWQLLATGAPTWRVSGGQAGVERDKGTGGEQEARRVPALTSPMWPPDSAGSS